MALCSLKSPTVVEYDLLGLAGQNGFVSVGRESNTAVRLDCPEVPFLLSRRHALFTVQPDGSMAISDCNSTNGTYTSRCNEPLRKLPAGRPWTLEDGDVIGFGGPDTIIARRAQVANPFLYKFYGSQEAADAAAAEEVSYSAQEDRTMNVVEHQMQEAHMVQPAAAVAAASVREPLAERQEPSILGHHQQQQQQQPLQELGSICDTYHKQQHLEFDQASAKRRCDSREGKENAFSSCHAVGNATHESCSGRSSPALGAGMADLLGGHLACPICHEWLLASHNLSCGHMFCGPCLASWLPQKQSCPTCRKPIAGIPVRCFLVDNAISDLLGVESAASPSSKQERKRKQTHWESVQGEVTQNWALALKRRQERALEAANRHRNLLSGSRQAAAAAPQHPQDQPSNA